MPESFLACDRGRVLLVSPSLVEWLAEGHFAWFVLAAVEEMDLWRFMAPIAGTATVVRRSTGR